MRVHPKCRALCFEQHPERAERIKRNALKHGVDQLRVICGTAPDILQGHDAPDAIFVGGGLSDDVLHTLQDLCPGVRLVANAVTLESETTLQRWHAAQGGALIRLDFSRAVPLGARTGWKAAFPIVQWSGVL
jgi:precorrin-6Y C5,15-methyltransferase (decarboxylating)